ncbi:MAG: twin-arginine translocase subunit TatC [Actinomycetota bacterium]|jgi:sec-independent protein translocase protein TatC|nr:twin-arginine translocase subunit TatC [Rubrobacter sp.]MBA3790821.1 twin-arginine translocase subunit TatC [Rubrobacter sp.]MDQ3238580.1 twin-arginine translocase subunit TatC [Actinomycetota bacterium]MDQ3567661.1 twin-arginine translocase subunit TatC [Actinomycetota bacterium]
MTLIEHLGEFRSRIIKVAIAFFAVAIVSWFFIPQIFALLLEPSGLEDLNFTSPAEALVADVKLALFTAFLLTIPILLYQIWAFVAPAVGDLGKAFTYTLITLASALFLAGVAFGYFVVLPIGIQFLLSWGGDRYNDLIISKDYMAFVTRFLLAFGIVFEFPAATYVGAKLELVDAPILKKYRKHAIVANTVLAAALTPGQDPFSMVLMALPMIVMYEVSIVIARYVNPVSEVAIHERDPESGDFEEVDEDAPGRNGYEDEDPDGR